MRRPLLRATWVIAVAAPLAAAAAAPVQAATVRAGFAPGGAALRLDGPGLALRQRGAIVLRTPAGSVHATRVLRRSARAVTLATSDGHTTVHVAVRARGEGALGVLVRGDGLSVTGVRLAFAAGRTERFLGFGERADAVEHRGRAVDAYVSDGPYPARRSRDRRGGHPAVGAPALRRRDVLPRPLAALDAAATACSSTRTTAAPSTSAPRPRTWARRASTRARLRLRVFAGPRPADALRRFTAATGRQPAAARRWVFGPWFQTGQNDATPPALERAWTPLRDGRRARLGRQTHTHYLPCGAQRGGEAAERARARAASTPRASPSRPTSTRWSARRLRRALRPRAAATGACQTRSAAAPYLYPASSAARSRLARLGQFDFGARAGRALFGGCCARPSATATTAGWRTSASTRRSTPSRADGTPGTPLHNRYPRQYHCAAAAIARRQRPPARALHALGLDRRGALRADRLGRRPDDRLGLRRPALGGPRRRSAMGLSGVGRWGSDIGGYFSLGDDRS